MSYNWYEIKELKGTNIEIGALGASKYIINENLEPISEGYHEIFIKDGKLLGQMGSTIEHVKFLIETSTECVDRGKIKSKIVELLGKL